MTVTHDFVYTTCDICMIRCGMKVHRRDGKAVFIEGNPADPFNKGKLCPKGVASLGFLNNPDRMLYPMKRTNPEKGFGIDPGWERITWDEAMETIVDKILEATEDGAYGERFALVPHGGYGLVARLLASLGSPNLVTHYDTCFSPYFVARKALLGGNIWTNLKGARYMLSFGWDQSDRSKNTPTQQVAEAISEGAKIVVFNPFQGQLGAKGNEWIPIKPGTDPAVALAMINHIISNDLYDRDFVNNKTNFMEHETVIREHFAQYTPEWAESISDVPASTIVRIAEEFTDPNNGKRIVPNHKRDGAGGPNYANSYVMAHAIIVLNTLVGAIDREGGEASMAFGWKPKPHLEFVQNPEKSVKELIFEKGSIDGKHEFPLVAKLTTDRGIFTNTAERILNKDPNELKMAIFRRYGLLSFPNPPKIAEALKTLDFVVFMDTLPKDICYFADILLPESTFLEKNFVSFRKFTTPGYKLIFSGNAVQDAAGESKGWTGVLMDLGKRLDERRNTKFFWINDGGTERPVTPTDEKNSIMANVNMTFADLKVQENGVWQELAPYTSKSSYSTPSGKIEIFGNLFEEHGYEPLPTWVPKAEMPSDEYPFYLLLRRWPGHKHSAPLTMDNPYALDAFPDNVAWINASSAARLGIADGDNLEVASSNGSINIKARLTERIRGDCVMVQHNFGHTVPELKYAGNGAGDGYLIPDRPEEPLRSKDWSAGAWMSDVVVKVTIKSGGSE